jgi:hypothetical protein
MEDNILLIKLKIKMEDSIYRKITKIRTQELRRKSLKLHWKYLFNIWIEMFFNLMQQ